MSDCHFANAIDKLLKDHKMTQADLWRASGVNEAQLSRFINGTQVWVSPADLLKIAKGLCPKSKPERLNQIHAQLLYAHLQDECTGPGAKLVAIELIGPTPTSAHVLEDKAAPPALPPKIQRNLDIIAQHVTKDSHVRKMVETMANLCRREPLP